MLGFIVPIKPKAVSKNWNLDNRLLERTLHSICAQTDQRFAVIVVYTDLPQVSIVHQNIHYLKFPFEPVKSDEFEDLDYVLKYYAKEYAEKMFDKGKKIIYGCKRAVELGCVYLMGVDSDDLVCKNLVEFVNKGVNTNSKGWRITKGFIYEENAPFVVKKYDIQNINGSTHIIHKQHVDIPSFSSKLFWNFSLYEAHGYTYHRLRDYKKVTLQDVPFFAIIYIIHSNNYSGIQQALNRFSFKKIVKIFLRGRYLSKDIREAFNLYKLEMND